MKNFFNLFKNRILLFFSIVLFISLIPYFIFYFKEPFINKYVIEFKTEVVVDNVFNIDNIRNVKNYYIEERENEIKTKGSSKKVDYTKLDESKVVNDLNIEKVDDYYKLSVSKKYYSSLNMAKKLYSKILTDNLGKDNVIYLNDDIIYEETNINILNVYLISLVISIIVVFVLYLILYITYPSFYNEDIKYDNSNLYRTIFHKSYWKGQTAFLYNIKKLSILTMLFSLMIITKFIKIPSGFSNLGLGLGYLFFSTITMIFGPISGLFIGFLSDIIGFIISPSPYGFYFPYTISSMLAGFVYGICFYKTNISFSKCLLSRFIVNIFINTILGSIWWSNLQNFNYEQFKNYLLFAELPKNLLYLIPQSVIQFIVLKALIKPSFEFNLISLEQKESVRII